MLLSGPVFAVWMFCSLASVSSLVLKSVVVVCCLVGNAFRVLIGEATGGSR